MITIKEAKSGGFLVTTKTGLRLGEISKAEDGYYYWWPPAGCGICSSSVLHAIAAKIVEMNKVWDETVQKELASQTTPFIKGKDYVPSKDDDIPF